MNTEQIVAYLNDIVKVDPQAITNLIELRVGCNEALANHEHVQVRQQEGDEVPLVGFLGIICGLAKAVDNKFIVAFYQPQCKKCGLNIVTDEHINCPNCGKKLKVLVSHFEVRDNA